MLVTNIYILLVKIISYYWAVGSFPQPWACTDTLLALFKEVVICTFVRKHLLPLLFLYELYPYSLTCLFMYSVCGLDVSEKQNWFYCKSRTSLITPKSIPHIFNQITFILAPMSGLPKIPSLTEIFLEYIFSPTDFLWRFFCLFFWQAWWKVV